MIRMDSVVLGLYIWEGMCCGVESSEERRACVSVVVRMLASRGRPCAGALCAGAWDACS